MRFAQPLFLWVLLVALPAAAGLFYWSWRVKQKLIRQFVHDRLLPNLTVGLSTGRQMFRFGLLTAALAGVLLAMAKPQWGWVWEEAKQKGLDIIMAVDTSRSMLAQDVAPNRLERAKLACFDLMKEARNDRLGLVAFAGTAFLQSPLTLDDQAFRQGVEALNVGIIPQGGTALSAAIHTAMDAFEKNNDNHKVLVLFTDGEDHDADTETLAAAKEAAEAGMHIFTIGVGTPEGELLRVKDDQGNYSFIKDEDGNVVKSHLNKTLLQQIATTAQGFYLPLQGPDPMATLYARGLAPLPKDEETTRLTRVPKERYHWPLAFATICLLLEIMLPESPRRSRRAEPSAARTAVQAAAVAICLLLGARAADASPSDAYNDYESGKFKSAFDEYSRLSGQNTNDYRLHYDAGAAAYRAKQLEKAEQQFGATLASPDVARDLKTQERTYFNLGNTEFHLGEPLPDEDKKEERWKQAIDSYTQALNLAKSMQTNDIDAQNNLAFVKQKLEQLKQQQQQQQKKDNKDQKDQDQKDDQDQQNKDQKNQKDKKDQKESKQDQKKDENKKSAQDKKKDQEKKKQQEQAKRDQQKKDQEKKEQQEKDKSGEPKDQSQEQAQQAAAGQMTPQEARQILAAQKDDEKALIFAPDNQPVKTQGGKIKDW